MYYTIKIFYTNGNVGHYMTTRTLKYAKKEAEELSKLSYVKHTEIEELEDYDDTPIIITRN